MVTTRAIVFGELGPRASLFGRRRAFGAIAQKRQRGSCGGNLTGRPGLGTLATLRIGTSGDVLPMGRDVGHERGKLEVETRMAGRQKVVIDLAEWDSFFVVGGGANMTAGTTRRYHGG